MDKRTLTANELQQVKDFIYSRGFRDELVVNEILDHFACKVEEELMKNPKVTLSEAMYDAHRSFGVLGFYVIQANFEKNTKSRYRELYWQSLKTVLTSVRYVLLSLTVWLCIYYAYLWADINNYRDYFDQNYVVDLIFVLILGSLIYTLVKYRPHNNYYYQVARQAGWYSPFWIGFVMGGSSGSEHVVAHSVFFATITTLSFILQVVQWRLLDAASVDYNEFKEIAE